MNVDLSDPEVVARRKAVWGAISDLCLDTEITDATIGHIARVIKEQGFSADEAEHIAFHEVFPAIFFNMLVLPGGEWMGFNEDWLVERITGNSKKTWFGRLKLHLWQKEYRRTLQPDWDRVLAALK